MTIPFLIIVFCLGLVVGMVYTYVVYRIAEWKYNKNRDDSRTP